MAILIVAVFPSDCRATQDYVADLDRRIEDLHARVHEGGYRALPSRRRYIPKSDGKQRPLAVAALEDKIVQRAMTAVLNAIYEEDFLGLSYGFRPKRGQHDALDALVVGISSTKVNYILDADIRSFFDDVSHEWLIKFLNHRIGDPRIIRLIQKMEWSRPVKGERDRAQWSHHCSRTFTFTMSSTSGPSVGDGARPRAT